MAKGDDSRARNQIDQQGGLAQNHLDNLRNDMIVPQAQQAWNDYANARDRSNADYGNIMGQYQGFAKDGGFSPMDLANIRARAVAPIRGVYAGANREVDRQRALQGGYSPGYGVLKSRMARDMSSGLSDATTNAEGMIAEMINSGKRFGVQGQQSLFGTTPGQASFYGGMHNQAMNNWLQTQGLQNQLGLGMMNAQINASQIPGKWEHTMGRIGQVGNMVGNIAGIPWGGSGMQGIMAPKSGTEFSKGTYF
jgi:hypothetical protein